MTPDERLERLERLEKSYEANRISSEARLQSIERSLHHIVVILERRTINPALFWAVITLLALGEILGWFLPVAR